MPGEKRNENPDSVVQEPVAARWRVARLRSTTSMRLQGCVYKYVPVGRYNHSDGKPRNRRSPVVFRIHLVSKNKDFRHVPPDGRNMSGSAFQCRDPSPNPKQGSLRRVAAAELRSLAGAVRFGRSIVPKREPRIGRRCGESEVKYDQWETTNKNNSLRLRPNHGCVLFVQHPSENALQQPHLSGSFIACVRTFSNCGDATEGGIPRSSRS